MSGVIFLLALLTLSPALLAEPQRGSRKKLPRAPEYFKEFQSRKDQDNLARVVLRNGLTILVEEHPSTPLVAITTYLRPRPSLGPDPDRLLSETLAEMLLQQHDLKALSYDAGAVFTADEGRHGVRYASLSPADHLEKTLATHAALLRPIKPEKVSVERALRVVAERRSRAERFPFIYAKNRLTELVAPLAGGRAKQQPQSPDPGASGQLGADPKRLVEFHLRNYQPRNLILAVSGAVLKEKTLEYAIKYYAKLGTGQPSEKDGTRGRTSLQLDDSGLKYLHRRGAISAPHVVMGYRIPGLEHQDYHALLLLSYILGQGESCVLSQKMVRPGIAFSAESVLETTAGSGTFWIQVKPGPGKVDQAEVQVLAQIEIVRRQGISSGQLGRAKALLTRDFYKRMEDLDERAFLMSLGESAGQFWDRQLFLRQIQSIKPAQIQQVAKRHFRESNLAVVEYFPKRAEARTFTLDSFREMLQLLIPTSVNENISESEVALGSSQNQRFAPLKFESVFVGGDLKSTSILRGPSVHFREARTVPLVHVGLFFPGGRRTESINQAGITELMLRTSFRSMLKARGELSWNDLEMMGIEIKVVNEPDFFGLKATVLSRHTSELFSFLIDWFRSPVLDEGVFEAERQKTLAELQWQEDEWFLHALRRTRQLLFGQHSYALNQLGTKESVPKLTLKMARTRMDSQMTGIHPWIFLRGDIQGTSFLGEFVSRLSDSNFARRDPAGRADRGQRQTGNPSLSGEHAQYEREGTVMVGLNGPAQGTRDWLIWEVWQTLLLSPELSAILAPDSQTPILDSQLFRESGFSRGGIFAFALSATGSEKAAGKELIQRLSNMEQAPFTRNDLLNAVVGSITRFHMDRQVGSEDLLLLAKQVLGGHGVEFQREYISGIKLVTPGQIRAFARRYFPANKPSDQEAVQRP